MWQKTEARGLFFTGNLASSLNMAVRAHHWKRHNPTTSEVSAIRNSWSIPHHLSSHLLHLAAPCRALQPQEDPATSTGSSSHVPRELSRYKDARHISCWKNTTLQREKRYCDYMVRIGFRIKTLNVKFQMGWSHTLQVCASIHKGTMWRQYMCVHMYIHTLLYVWVIK